MDLIFKPYSQINHAQLNQGDVLLRTPEVVEVLHQAHSYYAQAADYTHFVVVTQSCDLVLRRGSFNAPYITIAAAKPFSATISQVVQGESQQIKHSDIFVHTSSKIQKIQQLLERYLNNSEAEHFFLPASEEGNLKEDLLVFLRLSIALRKSHYDVIAAAKIAELDDIFQAKLGWLKGNIYSRIATPDLEETKGIEAAQIKKQFYEKYLPSTNLVTVSNLQAQRFRELVAAKAKELNRDLTREEGLALLEQVPTDIDIVASVILDRLVKNGVVDPKNDDLIRRAKSSIANTPEVKSLVNQR